jgi:AcrR family transcriptional regulator
VAFSPAGVIERNGNRTREAVLDAAERLFAEKGYDATSLNDVGTAAGVSRGTPGYFFGSKTDLYRQSWACFGAVAPPSKGRGRGSQRQG